MHEHTYHLPRHLWRIAVLVVAPVACAPMTSNAVPSVAEDALRAEPIEAEMLREIRGSDPTLARTLDRLVRSEAAAWSRGHREAAVALGLALEALLEQHLGRSALRVSATECKASLAATEQRLLASERAAKDKAAKVSAEQAPQVRAKKSRREAPAENMAAPAVPTDVEATELRLKLLAGRAEELSAAPGSAKSRARLEVAQQLLLDANRAFTHGLLAEANRLLSRCETTLEPSKKLQIASPEDALKGDAERVFGARVEVRERGIVLRLADAGKSVDPELLERLEQFLTVHRNFPIAALGPRRKPGKQVREFVGAVAGQTARPPASFVPEDTPFEDHFLWIEFSN